MGKAGKGDFFSPKNIANRIKAKGLQKLRWYCQMCNKQCRDENGFKCHQTSESHKRQMLVFGQAPEHVIDGFSQSFLNEFVEHLRRSHPHSRVAAKIVYNEYIANRHHVHMNATKWLTLTDFIKYLGREGFCKVDETEKGWYISLIQRDPAEELAAERRAKRERAEADEAERQRENLTDQIQRAAKHARPDEGPAEATELQRDAEGEPLRLALAAKRSAAREAPAVRVAAPAFEAAARDDKAASTSAPRARSKAEELMQRELAAKRGREERAKSGGGSGGGGGGRKDAPWLLTGIIVKVMSRELAEHGYYKQKGVVEKLVSKYVAQVSMLGSGDLLQVDQAHLETVLPAAGGGVRVLGGCHRGAAAEMLAVEPEAFQARVRIRDGPDAGTELRLDYEDVCKLASA
ncbi:hypothetical protein WJX81_002048 [Elliptochloris bilobata]|uniref:C2H2-type domain-containing protein n=1 Tax=Elliptochloris bilobata TaxID=381761 RepID=A0AAW1RGR6_9CHLO